MIRKPNCLITDMENVLMVLREDQTSHDIPLSQSLNLSKVLTLFNFLKVRRGEGAAEEKLEISSSLSMSYKRLFHNVNLEGEEASTDVEAVASYLEDLSKLIRGDD